MRISAALPRGVHALLFESAARRRRLESALAARLEAAGFSEVVLPVLDFLEPYAPLLPAGRGGAERYHLLDRDGELLALRADFTPMLARLLAPRLPFLPRPLRLFYRGDVVRLEDERPGGQREFYQVGAELLGLRGERAERAMLRLCLELLALGGTGGAAAGAGENVQVVLGFAGALDQALLGARGADPAALALAVERRERAPVRRAAPELLRVLESGVPERPETLGARASRRLTRLLALRDDLARRFPAARLTVDLAEFARYTLDPRLGARPAHAGPARKPSRLDRSPARKPSHLDRSPARKPSRLGARLADTGVVPAGGAAERPAAPAGIGYYDGLVFRAWVGSAAQPVASGGRYDRLFRALGAEIPAVGFSLSVDRWLAAVAAREESEAVEVDPPAAPPPALAEASR